MPPEMKLALITIGISVLVALIGTGGAALADYLDAHGHKAAARLERAVVRALVDGIQDEQHPDTQDAIARRASFTGVDNHPEIVRAINGS